MGWSAQGTDRTELARKLGLVLWGLLLLGFVLRLGVLLFGDPVQGEVLRHGEVLWAELVRTLLMTLSFALIVFAYWIRTPPRVRAVGWAERYFPLLVVALVFGYAFFRTPPPPLELYLLGTALCLAGWAISVWAIAHLRGSLSMMAEVRELVQGGPYRLVRHPLYLGEMINWCGLAVLYTGWPVALYTAALIVLQALRARVEERKLQAALGPAYEQYRSSAGFLWPRFRRTN
jgi:protein-S-isoprenylcysteine O-methyltransferase Ste14